MHDAGQINTRRYCLQCYSVTLLAKPGRVSEHMKYFFCCGGGGCGVKLQGKQILTPDLLHTSTVPSSTLPQFFQGLV